jgi:4-cresol dehydrogenase (hydroxylating)
MTLGAPARQDIAALHRALAEVFPPERLLLAADGLAAWAATTHRLEAVPNGVVATAGTADVVQAQRIAASCGIPAYAISRGRNIGLGGRLPPHAADQSLIIDLQLHRSILAVDEHFGIVALEPGVTFTDLHAALRERGSQWFLPSSGGPPDGSVLGNMLERGDGNGPHGDRTRALLDLEAVLPTGERLTTRRDLAGPDLSGLFFQSGAGIVTRATVALVRLPRLMTSFVLKLRPEARLGGMVDAAAACYREGILAPGSLCIWNGTKRAIRDGQAVDAADMWVGSGAMHAASRRRAEADWQDLLAEFACAGTEVLEHGVEEAPKGSGILQGEPTEANLVSIVSGLRAPGGTPGFAWVCPVLPFEGGCVERVATFVTRVLLEAGMPPNIALGCRDARTIRGYIALAWDRGDTVAEKAAYRAHDRLLNGLAKAGFPPFRLGQLSRGWQPQDHDDTGAVTARVLASLAGWSPHVDGD